MAKTTVQIRRWDNDRLIHEHTCEENSVKVTLEHGVSDGVDFIRAYLRSARLQGANLKGANFNDANLEGANLTGANLRSAELKGANIENADLRGAILYRSDLRFINLAGAKLAQARLCGSNLAGANFFGAIIYNADFSFTNLAGANFDRTNLGGANFCRANLKCTNLDVDVPPTKSHDFIAEILLRENHKYSREVAGLILVSMDWCWNDFLNYFDKNKIAWAKKVLCSKWEIFEEKFKP